MNRDLLILILMTTTQSMAAAQSDTQSANQSQGKKLDVRLEQQDSSLVSLDGFVKSRGKYSFEIDTGTAIHSVGLAKEVTIKLKVSSPRIDLDEKQLIIDVEGAEKRFRGYPIPVPLFIRMDFVHQNQIKRIAAQSTKRISNFELLATNEATPAGNLSWFGEIKKGTSNRQLRLKIQENEYDVLLGKRGTLAGFKISDLKAGVTGVRISGQLKDDGTIVADEVLFWPTASYKNKKSSQTAAGDEKTAASN